MSVSNKSVLWPARPSPRRVRSWPQGTQQSSSGEVPTKTAVSTRNSDHCASLGLDIRETWLFPPWLEAHFSGKEALHEVNIVLVSGSHVVDWKKDVRIPSDPASTLNSKKGGCQVERLSTCGRKCSLHPLAPVKPQRESLEEE